MRHGTERRLRDPMIVFLSYESKYDWCSSHQAGSAEQVETGKNTWRRERTRGDGKELLRVETRLLRPHLSHQGALIIQSSCESCLLYCKAVSQVVGGGALSKHAF
jgi:hypothetical protein